jgi:hypothetical protein
VPLGHDAAVEGSAVPRLRQAAAADGIVLHDDAMSLAELDGLLSAWRGDGVDRPWLTADVARYLALVLVNEVRGATAVDDGTVRLPDGSTVDAPTLVRERLTRPNADLRGVVREIAARPPSRQSRWRRLLGRR